jgi:hypothetical protein
MTFLLIMPGSKRRARLYGGEDMHQAWVIAPLSQDGLNPVFLTKGLVAKDELDQCPF